MSEFAIVLTAPKTIELRDVNVSNPEPEEIQVRCIANGICMFEVCLYQGIESPPEMPWQLGHEGVGIVTKVGAKVTGFREGDWCASRYLPWATLGNYTPELFAHLRSAPADPGIFMAEPVDCIVRALRSYNITPGDRVLLLGAGYMGLLNVQGLAQCPLADLVVADLKAHNLELAKTFGATETICLGTPEGKQRLDELRDAPFDLVIEAAGADAALQATTDLVRDGGRLCIFSWHHERRLFDFGKWHTKGITVVNSGPNIAIDHNVNTIQRAAMLMERGVFDQSELITHRHPATAAQGALERAAHRPADYCKGVLMF